jgi:molybdopterin molybdotransferase
MPGASAFRVDVEQHAAAVRELVAAISSRDAEHLPLGDALGRVTAAAVPSPVDLPLFRNSQMDGFAVHAADVAAASAASPVSLPVVGEVAAAPGEPAPLAPGTAVRIMTGAPVPEGADAVVPVEDTDAGETLVSIARTRAAGEFVREVGSDLRAGDVLVPVARRLASRHLAALAAAGVTTVAVRTRPRVAIVSTGSELAAAGASPGPGEIFDSNGVALVAAAQAAGAEVVLRAAVRDDAAEFAAVLDAALAAGAEVVVTSGGISMGEHEVVRETLEPHGARVGTVTMQPGGPQALARWNGIPVLAFPGNPVSSQLSFELFLAPVLREVAGLDAVTTVRMPLAHPVRSVAGKRQFLRGVRTGGTVSALGGPSSHLVATLAAADAYLIVPEAVTELAAGDLVQVLPL